jgi:hypothetical protein
VWLLQIVPDCAFFATKVQLGPEGVSKVLPLGTMTDFEQQAMQVGAMPARDAAGAVRCGCSLASCLHAWAALAALLAWAGWGGVRHASQRGPRVRLLLQAMLPELKQQIEKGVAFARK